MDEFDYSFKNWKARYSQFLNNTVPFNTIANLC